VKSLLKIKGKKKPREGIIGILEMILGNQFESQ
jgi:hypothetical protein